MEDWRTVIKPGVIAKKPYPYTELLTDIKLDQNESPYDLPESLKQEILDKCKRLNWNRYPSINGRYLIEALGGALGIAEDSLAVGVGSDDLLNAVAAAVLNPKKTVLYIEPTFSLYKQCAVTYEAQSIVCHFTEELSYPVETILKELADKQADLIFIASPNNPTGSLLELDSLEEILKHAKGIVVVDEAYYEFSGVTALDLQKKYRNLVITRTFSKAFGLAGLRIGYMTACSEIIECIQKVKMPFSLNVFCEVAAITILNNKQIIRQQVKQILKDKTVLWNALSAIPGIKVYPSAANFFAIDTGMPGKKTVVRIAEKGIAVRDISSHPMFENFIRVTVGTEEENKKLVEVMRSPIL